MAERQVGNHVLLGVLQAEVADAVAGREGDVIVAQHDALRRSRGARGVDQGSGLVHGHLGTGVGGMSFSVGVLVCGGCWVDLDAQMP